MSEHAAPHAAGTDPAPSTEDRLAEIRAREQAATPGPWTVTHRHGHLTPNDDESLGLGLEIEGPPDASNRGQFARGSDAQFIAHARADVPYLLALVDALIVENAEYRAAMQALLTHYRRHTEHRCEIERDAADLLAAESVECGSAILEAADRMRTALTKLNTLRDQVIRTQRASWSSVVYPLVAILNEAGFPSTVTDEELDRAPLGNRLDNAVTVDGALIPAQQRAPDHAYHSTATPHCGTVAGEGQS